MHFFDTTRVMVAGQALGLSEACLETSVKYVKERTAFGAPLGAYQLTQMKLTEMAIRIEALRGLVYKAAWLIDEGRPDYTLAAMAKFFGGQTAVFCANYAVELHGGYGYIEEYPVSKWYRDAKILELYEGTKEAEIMTIGRYLQAVRVDAGNRIPALSSPASSEARKTQSFPEFDIRKEASVKTRITELFGIEYPILLSGMSWISVPKMVAAVSNAGGLGILATGPLDADQTRQAIREIRSLTDKALRRQCHAAVSGGRRECEGSAGGEGAGDQLRARQGGLDREGGPRVRRQGDRHRGQRPPCETRPGLRRGRGDRDRATRRPPMGRR